MDETTSANSSYLHEVKAHVTVMNRGTAANYDVARIYNGANAIADSNYFCWDLCYGVDTDSSQFGGVYLDQMVQNSDFYIGVYIRGNNVTESDSLIYRFFNPNDANDFLDVTFYVNVSPTVSTIEAEVKEVNIYPNPANDIVNVSARNMGEGRVRLMNLAGVVVRNEKFNGQTDLRLDVRELPAGVYMLQTINDGQVQDAQRVVIAH